MFGTRRRPRRLDAGRSGLPSLPGATVDWCSARRAAAFRVDCPPRHPGLTGGYPGEPGAGWATAADPVGSCGVIPATATVGARRVRLVWGPAIAARWRPGHGVARW